MCELTGLRWHVFASREQVLCQLLAVGKGTNEGQQLYGSLHLK